MTVNLNKTKFDIAYSWVRNQYRYITSLEYDTDYAVEMVALINDVLAINPMREAAEIVFYGSASKTESEQEQS